MPETDDSRLLDLIVRWEELRDAGQVVSPESLCADCPELLPALQERLNALQAVDGALRTHDTQQTLDHVDAGKTAGSLPRPTREGTPGATIPGYQVVKELGRGGMGVVYLARQEGVGRLVAVKMLLSGEHAAAKDRARFEAEIAAIGRLQHPNLVQVFEVNQHEGRAYFSMEYLDGGSLEDRIAGRAQPARQAAETVQTLATAMHAAHQQGIVHRDLKPGNVLLSSAGVPKIGDFGLAKRLDVEDGPTLTRHVLGTPSYMAPEQAKGQSRHVDARTDVYALGAILYEMLTGRPPFVDESIMGLLIQVAQDDPLSPRHLSPSVPQDLETICLKCLQKDPTRRYVSAAALADDLGRFLADEPVLARPAGRWLRLRKWVRRRPTAAALIAVSSLALLSAVVAGLWFTHRLSVELEWTRQARSDAETARRELKQSLVEQVVEWLADDVRQLEAVPQTVAALLARRTDWEEEDLAAWMRALVEKDERIFGLGVALEPRKFGGANPREDFCLYAYRTPMGVVTKQLLPPASAPPFYRDRQWYAGPKKLRQASWTEPYLGEGAENTPMVTYSVPIIRKGEFIGVVAADLSINYIRGFHDDIQGLKLGSNTTCLVVTPGGTLLYHPDSRFEFPAKDSSLTRVPAAQDFLTLAKRMEAEDSGQGTVTDFATGRTANATFSRVPSTRWQFVVLDDSTEPVR